MIKEIKFLWEAAIKKIQLSFTNGGEVLEVEEKEDYQTAQIAGNVALGPGGTVVHVLAEDSFSFFLRDVTKEHPVYIPEYGVIVTLATDNRKYGEIEKSFFKEGYISYYNGLKHLPEANFEAAAKTSRNLPCKTWLGIGRDVRIFELDNSTLTNPSEPLDSIVPYHHSTPVMLHQEGESSLKYYYALGRGVGVKNHSRRRLEKGFLPILNTTYVDDNITYSTKSFAALEASALVGENVVGTDFRVADTYSLAHGLTDEQKETAFLLKEDWITQEQTEEVVLYLRIQAVNTDTVPRYSFVRLPQPNGDVFPKESPVPAVFSRENGFTSFGAEVCVIALLNGKPAPSAECSILLQPGETAEYIVMIPHKPISHQRAVQLAKTAFYAKYQEAVLYWENHLAHGASIEVPEPRIEEMIKAGQLHLDMVCYGKEPDEPVAPVVGVYTPIGTESVPIVRFLDFMGNTKLAQRGVQYFIEKQQETGFIQNFQTYMSETGSALWMMGEHYHVTKDKEWLSPQVEKILKSCTFLENWMTENKREDLRGKGYGMIAGKVADPEDPYHSYMLNGSVYAGLDSMGRALQDIKHPKAELVRHLAEELKENILASLEQSFALAPVIPLADGSWAPAIAPWTEDIGALALKVREELIYSHGSILIRDSIIGVLYLLLYGVVSPESRWGQFMMRVSSELFFSHNTAFSQPYYSIHPFVHLSLNQVEPFLLEFYSSMAALADRETYSFWEHLHQVSPHKTHEEAWFLMRCKWMLCMDESDLHLLAGVPRDWLTNSKKISVKNVKTRYGELSYEVVSRLEESRVDVWISLGAFAEIPSVRIRIPHPQKQAATSNSSGGVYDPATETLLLENFTGEATFSLYY